MLGILFSWAPWLHWQCVSFDHDGNVVFHEHGTTAVAPLSLALLGLVAIVAYTITRPSRVRADRQGIHGWDAGPGSLSRP